MPGIFAAQVSSRWQHAPSPYGPLWTLLGEGSADVTGGHLVLGVLALRTWAALGLGLLACTVPGLAARFAGRPDIALWLVVVNPVVLVVVLGGGHNDLLMIGLVAAGLGAALSARPARWALPLAGALVASAALIKAPAALALPFLVPLRLCGAAGTCAPAPPRLLVAAYGRVLLGAVAAGGVITVGCGQSLGWVGQLGRSPNDVYGWVSLVNPVIFAVRLAGGSPGGPLDPGSAVVRSTDLAAAGLTLVLAAVGWWRAHLDRPALWLAVTFVAAVLLAPTIRPWYACWPLVLVAVALRPGRWVLAAVAVSLVCTFGNGPGGKSALSSPGEAVVAAVAVSGVVLALCLPVLRSGRAQRTSSATG